MLTSKRTEEILNNFFKELIKQSRANLTRQKKNASKDLYNNIEYDVKVNPNSIETYFGWPIDKGGKYADFIDKGVKGVDSGRSLAGYRYTTKRPPVREIKKWMRVKPVKARDRSTGRFITQEQGAYLIANAIFKRGLTPTQFYSKPFERLYLKLPDELIEAYGDDLDDFLNFELNDNG